VFDNDHVARTSSRLAVRVRPNAWQNTPPGSDAGVGQEMSRLSTSFSVNTVTSPAAVPPSTVAAMRAVPDPIAVTRPPLSTVATLASDVVHRDTGSGP